MTSSRSGDREEEFCCDECRVLETGTRKTYVWKIDLKEADLSSHVQELSSEDDDAVL